MSDRSERAKIILGESVLTEAFDDVRAAWIRALESVGFEDRTRQHEITLALQNLKAVRKTLERYVEEGKFEDATVRERTMRARLREVWNKG
jgi:aspartate aminotransferase-like enzyme